MDFLEYGFQFLSQVLTMNTIYEAQKILISITGVSVLSKERRLDWCLAGNILRVENNCLAILVRYLNTMCIILIIITTLTLFGG